MNTEIEIKVNNQAAYKINILKAVLKFINWLPQSSKVKPNEFVINVKIEVL